MSSEQVIEFFVKIPKDLRYIILSKEEWDSEFVTKIAKGDPLILEEILQEEFSINEQLENDLLHGDPDSVISAAHYILTGKNKKEVKKEGGDVFSVDEAISILSTPDITDLRYMRKIMEKGYLNIINFILKNKDLPKETYDEVLKRAAFFGYIDILESFYKTSYNIYSIIEEAIKGNQKETYNYLAEKCKEYIPRGDMPYFYYRVVITAIRLGKINMLKHIIEKENILIDQSYVNYADYNKQREIKNYLQSLL